jgi:hypothetical protein
MPACPPHTGMSSWLEEGPKMTTRISPHSWLLIAAMLVILSALPAAAVAQTPLFNAPRDFTVGSNPHSVAVDDMNGDGMHDLVVADAGSDTVSVLLGNGDGTFRAVRSFPTGTNPLSVALADLNGDGKVDVALANYGSSNVSALLGNGDGTLQAPRNFDVAGGPRRVAAGDFNGDRVPDLAVACFGGSTVSILQGIGDGTFQPARNVAAGSGPFSVTTGDFNADGRLDVAAANYYSGDASVLLGNGDGTFQAPRNATVGPGLAFVSAGDVDRDGKLDLALANYGSNSVSVLLGNGDGSFQTARNFATEAGPWSVALGDFNGDGRPDLAVTNFNVTSTSILIGNGDGTFQSGGTVGPGSRPSSVAVADFDADARADLAVANYGGTTVSFIHGNGDGTFRAGRSFPTGTSPICVFVSDLNGDQVQDLVVGNFGSFNISVLQGNGDGTFQAPRNFGAGNGPLAINAGDFNGDRVLDLAVANHWSNDLSVFIGNGDGSFLPAVTYAVGAAPAFTAVRDLNGDGKLDLAVANSGAATVSVLLGNGDGTFQPPQNFSTSPGNAPASIVLTDLDGDGKLDLVTANYGSNDVSVLRGNGDGTFQAARTFGADFAPWSVALGDFNRDGKTDVAVANFNSTTASVLLGNGDATFQATRNFASGPSPHSIAVGEFNGDGLEDLVVANSGSTTVSVLLGNGDGTFEAPQVLGAGSRPMMASIGEFNGDGLPDMAVANIYSDAVAVVLGAGRATVATPVISPASGTYSSPVTVTITDSTPAAVIHYTTDGTTPTTSSTPYAGPLSITQTTTIKAMAVASGLANSDVASATYTIQQPRVATPAVSPAGGTYVGSVTVTITDSTPGATIYYTTNGTTPTASSTLYTGPISLNQTTTISAIAVASGMADSDVATATYTIQQSVATPSFSPPGGTYVGSVTVAIAVATPEATIHYTTDGSTPTSASAVYGGPLTLTQSATVRAMATASGMADSAVATATYTIQQRVATPALSPAGGTYVSSVTVTITDSTPGATIYYTTNGTPPTTASTPYTGPVSVSQTTTISAIAVAGGMADSEVATATYTIQQPVATPSFNPPGGTYVGSVTVAIAVATPGATIHYTTDGSTPTSASAAYGGPLTLTQSATVRAMATASGMADSAVASAVYVVEQRAATPALSPAGGTYVSSVTVTITTATAGADIHYTIDGSVPTTAAARYTAPISVTRTTTIRAMATASGMADSGVATAAYTIKAATPSLSLAGGTYFNTQTVAMSTATAGATIHYTTDGSTPTTASAVYTGPISVTESMTLRAIAVGSGIAPSDVASATYTLKAATPTFNPPGGSYLLGPLQVSISSASPGVTIFYTTDGSTPTFASRRYEGPILVVLNTTVKAIAVRSGWSQSAVGKATYTNALGL